MAPRTDTYLYAWTHEFTDEECPLIPGGIASQCVGSVPYLGYAFTLPEGFVADSATPLTITFVHPTDPAQNYSVANQPLSGAVLWPGASATAPLQWPGWVRLANGTYVETTGNYAWTRPAVTVLFEVNPSYQTTVNYPAESALCANPPANPPTRLACCDRWAGDGSVGHRRSRLRDGRTRAAVHATPRAPLA